VGEVEGPPRRPSWQEVKRELDDLVAQFGPRGTAFDSLSADVERLQTYVEQELDPAAKGVVVVANHHHNVFRPVPLDLRVPTSVTTSAIPSLRHLAHATESERPYAVLVADQLEAFLWLMTWQTWERGVQLESNDYPRHQQQGGWSQRRYQNRANERVEAFARTIAEEIRQELGEGDKAIPYLIIAADEPISSAVEAELHPTVKERILARIKLSVDATPTDVATATEPLIDEAERKRELELVRTVRDGVGANAQGVAGAEDTLTALQTGQVMTLVMNDDFAQPGWADYTLPLYGAGKVPKEHPAGGDIANLTPTSLADEAVRLALASDADVTLVTTAVPISQDELEHVPDADAPTPRSEAALALDALGGIGAVLRYTLADDQPTAEL
jgi:peptide subunit release factor 1 (eRF1)